FAAFGEGSSREGSIGVSSSSQGQEMTNELVRDLHNRSRCRSCRRISYLADQPLFCMECDVTATARGLFRATGNKAKPVHIMLDGEIVKADCLVREKDDFYPTPPEPTRAFLHAEIDRLRDF